jgi:hypothetical protein
VANSGGGKERVKRRIVQLSNDTTANYRVAIDHCPHCDKKFSFQRWERQAHTLILEPRIVKRDCVAVMAECPGCFENSWHHYRMSEFKWGHEDWPKSWRDAVAETRRFQTANALIDWKNSLCCNCSQLEKAEISTTAYRNCEIGSGSPSVQCGSFVQISSLNLREVKSA